MSIHGVPRLLAGLLLLLGLGVTSLAGCGSPAGQPAPTLVPSTTARPTSSYEQALADLARNELQEGLVAFNPPAEVEEGAVFRVTVRLQRGTSTSSALQSLPGPGTPTIEKVLVSATMSATLAGTNLSTEPVTPTRVVMLGTDVPEFAWSVRAEKPGPGLLTLTLVAEVGSQPVKQVTFNRDIQITVLSVVPQSAGERLTGWSGWNEVAVAVLGAAIIGAGGWFARRLRRGVGGGQGSGRAGDPGGRGDHNLAGGDHTGGSATG
jgi:hypothetical protein